MDYLPRSGPHRRCGCGHEHASFMDELVDDGFIVLGGPLDDGEHALLIVADADERRVRQRLGTDPWYPMDLLSVGTVQRWTIWLDGRSRTIPAS